MIGSHLINYYKNINIQLEEINSICEVIVVDDNSTIPPSIDIKKLNNIIELKVLRLKENLGSQKSHIIRFEAYRGSKRLSYHYNNGLRWRGRFF